MVSRNWWHKRSSTYYNWAGLELLMLHQGTFKDGGGVLFLAVLTVARGSNKALEGWLVWWKFLVITFATEE
jgi:hypothetical protein